MEKREENMEVCDEKIKKYKNVCGFKLCFDYLLFFMYCIMFFIGNRYILNVICFGFLKFFYGLRIKRMNFIY